MNFIKKLYNNLFKKRESYLVLCLNDKQAEDLFYRLRTYIRVYVGPYVASPSHRFIHVVDRHGDTRVKFISIRSNAYIATQVAHQGKTIAWTVIDEFLDVDEEKKDADT